MDHRRLISGLRIAVSATFGILCVMLIALWVRSYWRWDTYRVQTNSHRTTLGSNSGTFYLMDWSRANPETHGWLRDSSEAMRTPIEFRWRAGGELLVVVVPTWLPVILTGATAVIPWIQPSKRFRLRTLLVTTTLFGIVLGLAAYF